MKLALLHDRLFFYILEAISVLFRVNCVLSFQFTFHLYVICNFLITSTMFYIRYSKYCIFNSIYSFDGLQNFI